MRLAHLTFAVSPELSQNALDTLLAEVPVVRKMKGCIMFVPFVDPTVPGGLGVIHEWETPEDFAVYLASPAFAVAGDVLRPMMAGAPVSRRFDAKLVSTE